jgi:hypothetical protein
VPHWSLLYRRLRQRSNRPHNPTIDALHASTDSLRSASVEIEPPPENSTAPIVERPAIWPEIPETPALTLENMRNEEDNNSYDDRDDVHTPLLCSRTSTEAVGGDSTVAGDGNLEAEKTKSIVRNRPHNENDIPFVETSQLQRVRQIEIIVNINGAGEVVLAVNINGSNSAPVPIAQCSDQTLALATRLASSSLDVGQERLARVDMSRFRTTKILDKRSSPSGDEYKYEPEPQTWCKRRRWDAFTSKFTREDSYVHDALRH